MKHLLAQVSSCTVYLFAGGLSKAQRLLYWYLRCHFHAKDLKLEYPVGIYSLDIAYLPSKVDIESDGSYWHSRVKEKDARRDAELKAKGWTVIRLSLGSVAAVKRLDLNPIIKQIRKAA